MSVSSFAKSAFESTQPRRLSQGDYLHKKRARTVFCPETHRSCTQSSQARSYTNGMYLKQKSSREASQKDNPLFPANKNGLVSGQYSKLNLEGIVTIAPHPSYAQTEENNEGIEINVNSETGQLDTPSDTETPFLTFYDIDPNGSLFGTNVCGALNYRHHKQMTYAMK
jgi:hypothetical protein